MGYFSNKELKALEKEWNYYGQCHINEFLIAKFQTRYIHLFHRYVIEAFEKNVVNFNNTNMRVKPRYERVTNLENEGLAGRVGNTHIYLIPDRSNTVQDDVYLFSVRFVVTYDHNYSNPMVIMEVYLPEVDRIFPFVLSFDASAILGFRREGLFSLNPMLKDYYPDVVFSKYAGIFHDFEGVLICLFGAKIGHYSMQQTMDILMNVGRESWRPNIFRQYLNSGQSFF